MALGCGLARIGALGLRGGGSVLGAVVGRAGNAGGLLGLWLVVTFAALNANVDGGVEIGSGCANWQ